MRYYKLDENGKPITSYARQQPGIDLVLLDEPEDEFHIWNGTAWIFDVDSYFIEAIQKLRGYIYDNWVDAEKDTKQISTKFKEKKNQTYTTKEQVDTAIQEVKTDMFEPE